MVKVITYTTPDFEKYSLQLEKDCQKFNIEYLNYDVDMPDDFRELMKLKLRLIKKTLETNKKVLFIDVESRIVNPFPAWWYDCDFLVAKKINKTHLSSYAFVNTGFIWVDQARLDLIEKAIEIDNFVNSTESVTEKAWCDNLISMVALNNLDKVNFTELNYNRFAIESKSELVRGNWKNKYTVIQHPTDNAWADDRDFYNNAQSGIFSLVNHMEDLTPDLLLKIAELMIKKCDQISHWEVLNARVYEQVDGRNVFILGQWVFDPVDGKYSPVEYFNIRRKMFTDTDFEFVKQYVNSAVAC